jgi:hypothetical protein
MIFEALYGAHRKGELILLNGGFCRWHLRRDGQITIHEIISSAPGAGTRMLEILRNIGESREAHSIVAKCPDDLAANGWYAARGFEHAGIHETQSGRTLNIWRLQL